MGRYESPIKGSPIRNDLVPLSPTSAKRKLNQAECEAIYDRLVQYDERKKKAVLMLQEARAREEEQELQEYVNSSKYSFYQSYLPL
jgi:hypothetical protein